MSSNIKVGDVFGFLVVKMDLGLRKTYGGKRRSYYLCECECGNTTEVSGNALKTRNTQSCGCKHSIGEAKIAKILAENNISFKKEFSFPDLIGPGRNVLRFDFAIIHDDGSIISLVEFDGRQHRTGPEAGWATNDTLETILERDRLKDQYALDHNIPIYRIPSNQIGEISLESIFQEKFLVKAGGVSEK